MQNTGEEKSKILMAWDRKEVMEAFRYGKLYLIIKILKSGMYHAYRMHRIQELLQADTRTTIKLRLPSFNNGKYYAQVNDIVFIDKQNLPSIAGRKVYAEKS